MVEGGSQQHGARRTEAVRVKRRRSDLRSMALARARLLVSLMALATHGVCVAGDGFSGEWSIDLRTPAQRAQHAECGGASFVLQQTGRRVTGSHAMATAGCGRINEGGEGSVHHALLFVTSGRNGAVVKGRATLRGGGLYWETSEEVRAGEPEGDSPLILGKGLLTRVRK